MKLTALIPDQLLADVRSCAGRSTTTECVIVALREWVAMKQLEKVTTEVRAKPLTFSKDFSATQVRALSRRSRA
jgi:hypothetical protein